MNAEDLTTLRPANTSPDFCLASWMNTPSTWLHGPEQGQPPAVPKRGLSLPWPGTILQRTRRVRQLGTAAKTPHR
jgi:hypothetical protein